MEKTKLKKEIEQLELRIQNYEESFGKLEFDIKQLLENSISRISDSNCDNPDFQRGIIHACLAMKEELPDYLLAF